MTDKRGASTSSSGPREMPNADSDHTPGSVSARGASDISLMDPTDDAEALSEVGHDYLGDLQRLQAEFDNYRKRARAESAVAGDRGVALVIEALLPVLDNFELAIAHGEGGEGVQLVLKDLKAALESLGLEEVPAEGASFDPNVHEAVESRVVEGLEEPAIVEVYRRGYLHKGQLLRPAMVVVGRPAETNEVVE